MICSLSAFLNTEYKPQEFAIFVDLFLKTIAPYFRIVSVWITQGRLEDWRNEFVFAANPKFSGKRVKRKYEEEETILVRKIYKTGYVTWPVKWTFLDLKKKEKKKKEKGTEKPLNRVVHNYR